MLVLPEDTWQEFYQEHIEKTTGKKIPIKTGDKELDKLESMFAENNFENIADQLESFFLKYTDDN